MTEILVCSTVGYFADDVAARCATCDASIVHRPHAPVHLVKMCMRCAAGFVASSPVLPEVKVTEETRREMALFNATTKGTQ